MRGDQAAREPVDLDAVVVEVVLARDEPALGLEHARQAVADRGPAGAADVQRPGRVRGDELDVDRDAVVERAAPVGLALLDDALGELAGRRGIQADVEEAGAGDLGARDAVDGAERLGELDREVARCDAEPLAELERDVRCPVAVIAVARALERDVLGPISRLRVDAPPLRRLAHHVEQCGGRVRRDSQGTILAARGRSGLSARRVTMEHACRPPAMSSCPSPIAALAIALLAGCTPETGARRPPEPQRQRHPERRPAAEPTDQPVGVPVEVTCDELVSADTLYVYNPNFGTIEDFTPDEGTAAASALTTQGVACRWQNQTSGDTIDVSVAQLDEDTLTRSRTPPSRTARWCRPTARRRTSASTRAVGAAQVVPGPVLDRRGVGRASSSRATRPEIDRVGARARSP